MSNNKTDQILQSCRQQILNHFPETLAIYVFGSFGEQYETSQSDVDLALLTFQNIDTVELWRFAQSIAIGINRDVDLIDLRNASSVFKFQVVTTGKRIYCKDEKQCDAIENVYISRYIHFNEERADIIKSITGR